ncbi:unnamed protein product [Clonostachys chloroleuca]|uniref:Uncharacterized protein n=1 Tax=Clonostachys chloroleuca TaxID=1926264 RepID=A0AA35VRF8_9HYPO|nr:unnamed protein product [Clonostachys chloroleuca]
MATARQEAAQYRQAHQKINHTGNVLDGLENGLAARSVSGFTAAVPPFTVGKNFMSAHAMY